MRLTSYLLSATLLTAACTSTTTDSDADSTAADTSAMATKAAAPGERWTAERANQWYQEKGWQVGCDFIPSTAINQLEMWQAETFDPETIDRELGYAESIGFNSVRVYLHHLAWEIDKAGFKDRMTQYLDLADQHGISTMFCILDDVWSPTYAAGKQPDPKPGTHNSGWIQDPGQLIHDDSAATTALLETYVKDILTTFKDDDRVLLWDLYNEPGNSGWANRSMPLLEKMFQWGREVNPSQPLSAGVWNLDLKDLNEYQKAHSDVITYHNYGDKADHEKWIADLKPLGRPMLCTEYMARTRNSTFADILPMLKEENISAYNWGLVNGKTNTIYAWNTPIADGSEPDVWFHDIFRKDGTPYSQEEAALIKQVTSQP
ncbi:Cellulase (glycosyl hydrolase family 5) [Catalinimonas alkaloidigena]|uniref:Cellulase (Glycosyl hydrolase family 5) n=1 Tax=Catalinimonas alkaloidigena TaxID=1075417 RepID=A0A1G9A632_9BACT|nr:cellulase family glycosylhydrolase [Catalinimonas alkaloidigena]SDK22681.1 Cellulase (glycosyl hydrolase family 5) [Catalinimonas alkaloidigena]